jgi:hypothetical protein
MHLIEFRADGTYISGLCPHTNWCAGGRATASRIGKYVIRGNSVTLERGIVDVDSSRPEQVETYTWTVELRPNSSAREKMPRVLRLPGSNGTGFWPSMPPPDQPTGVARSS